MLLQRGNAKNRRSAVIRRALDGAITSLEPPEGAWKVEGISTEPTDGALDLLLVTDADDENIPAALLSERMILANPRPGG